MSLNSELLFVSLAKEGKNNNKDDEGSCQVFSFFLTVLNSYGSNMCRCKNILKTVQLYASACIFLHYRLIYQTILFDLHIQMEAG